MSWTIEAVLALRAGQGSKAIRTHAHGASLSHPNLFSGFFDALKVSPIATQAIYARMRIPRFG